MDGLSAVPWTARWCQGTLPCQRKAPKQLPHAAYPAYAYGRIPYSNDAEDV